MFYHYISITHETRIEIYHMQYYLHQTYQIKSCQLKVIMHPSEYSAYYTLR